MGIVDRVMNYFKQWASSRWLPWAVTGVVLLAVLLYELLPPAWKSDFPFLDQVTFLFAGLLLLALTWIGISRLSALIAERRQLRSLLVDAEQRVDGAYQRLETIFRVSQQFADANDENEVMESVLGLLIEMTGASGASFVPLDEHGQPQTALNQGELPFSVMEAWVEYLASPGVRQRCAICEHKTFPEKGGAVSAVDCPLLKGSFNASPELFCLPVRRGEREYGVFNLFLKESIHLDEKTQIYLRALIDEMAIGLEKVYLRRRELFALRQVQVLRQRTDLSALLNSLLENVYRTLDADFAVMIAPSFGPHQTRIDLTLGELPSQARPFINGILQGVLGTGEPILLGDVSGDPERSQASSDDPLAAPFQYSLMASPLLSAERRVLGVLMVGNRRVRSLHQRQLALLQTIAGQVALVVQNAGLMAELEFQSMIQERARLAREIHDGLAQTIGFLKLQSSQLRTILARGEVERARQYLDLFYSTLSEAYQDARQAIDGLRISPDECGLGGWLAQTTNEFRDLSGLNVELDLQDVHAAISPEVQAQLIRIMQEALSNVRKHASAQAVRVVCRETDDDLWLEVHDDGQGFLPEDIAAASRHGLRGMRERADLIGADFQVVSRPQEGTIVRLRLPVDNLEETIL